MNASEDPILKNLLVRLHEELIEDFREQLVKSDREVLDKVNANLQIACKALGLKYSQYKVKNINFTKEFTLNYPSKLLLELPHDERFDRQVKTINIYKETLQTVKFTRERMNMIGPELDNLCHRFDATRDIRTKIRIIKLSATFNEASHRRMNAELLLALKFNVWFPWCEFESNLGWEQNYEVDSDLIVHPKQEFVDKCKKYEGSILKDFYCQQNLLVDGSNPSQTLIDYRKERRVIPYKEVQKQRDEQWLRSHGVFNYEDIYHVADMIDDSSDKFDQIDPIAKSIERSALIDEARERWLRLYPEDNPDLIEEHSLNILLMLNEFHCSMQENLFKVLYRIFQKPGLYTPKVTLLEVRREYRTWCRYYKPKDKKIVLSIIVFLEGAYEEIKSKDITVEMLVRYYQSARGDGTFPPVYVLARTDKKGFKEALEKYQGIDKLLAEDKDNEELKAEAWELKQEYLLYNIKTLEEYQKKTAQVKVRNIERYKALTEQSLKEVIKILGTKAKGFTTSTYISDMNELMNQKLSELKVKKRYKDADLYEQKVLKAIQAYMIYAKKAGYEVKVNRETADLL